MEIQPLLRQLVAHESHTSSGKESLRDFLLQWCAQNQVHAEVWGNVNAGGGICFSKTKNVQENKVNSSNKKIFWVSHLDTPHPGASADWQACSGNPYELALRDGKYFGLGILESKADFASRLFAFKATPEDSVVMFAHFSNESLNFSLEILKKIKNLASSVLISEPTELLLKKSQMGQIYYEIKIVFSKSEKEYFQNHASDEITSTQTKVFQSTPVGRLPYYKGPSALDSFLQYVQRLPQSLPIVRIDLGQGLSISASDGAVEVDMNGSIQDGVTQKLMKIIDWMNTESFVFTQIHSNENEVTLNCVRHGLDWNAEQLESYLKSMEQQIAKFNIQQRVCFACEQYDGEMSLFSVKNIFKYSNETSVSSYFAALARAAGIPALGCGVGQWSSQKLCEEHVTLQDLQRAIPLYLKLAQEFQ